ncbi:hypothetical protein C8R42DRAFT_669943 [Lentinula raphanica]|nr:hypothetical protein C8R42DRAFT_669943 [Lentinula raphanica]
MDTPASRILAGLVLPSPSPFNFQNHTISSSSTLMTHTTPQNASNFQFDQIDQEILRYEEAVRELKFRRNLLAPISKLPAEILCAIFMFCNVPETPSNYASYNPHWRWVTVTHISRLWRNTALNCPALWSKPEFTRTEWAHEMIKRSKMAPLTIEVNSNIWLTPRVLDAVSEGLKHLPRIHEIRLSASRDNMVKLLGDVNRAAPFLRTLTLDVGRNDYHYHPLTEPCMLPDDFLAGDASRLSHVELTRCHLSWDSTLFQNVNISFLKVHSPGAPAPTLDQFIGALIGMPQLEVLDLENTLPASSVTGSIEKPGVSLPRLRRLRTVGTIDECAIFLQHVVVPPNTIVHLVAKCKDVPEVGSPTLQLVHDVCQHLPVVREIASTSKHSSAPLIKSLLVQSSGPGDGVLIEAWSTVPKTKLIHPALYPRDITFSPASVGWLKVELSWRHVHFRQCHDEVIQALCRPLPLAQLRNLHIKRGCFDDSFDVSSATISSTFGTLPKINSVTIEGDNAYSFVGALTTQVANSEGSAGPSGSSSSSRSGPSSGRPTLAFPALRNLKLLDVDFDRASNDINDNGLMEPLMDCLMQRYEYKAEIHKLILERCSHFLSDDVGMLEEIVADVEWDEIETGYSDEEEEEEDMDYYDEDDMDPYGDEGYYGYGAAYFDSEDEMMFLGF